MATPSTAISRLDLSGSFSEFDLAASKLGFIGHKVLVPRSVGLQKANVGKIPLESLLVDRETMRAPKGSYSRSDFSFATFSYDCREFGCEEPIDDWTANVYTDILDMELIHAQRGEDALLRGYERAVAAAVFNPTTFASMTSDVGIPWDTHASSVPLNNVQLAKQAVLDASGLRANALVVGSKAFYNLKRSDQLTDLIKYSQQGTPGTITASMVAQAMGLDFVFEGSAVHNPANEAATAVPTPVWDDEYALVARVAITQDPREPCLGRTFCWAGDGPGAPGTGEPLGVIIEEYREEGVRSSIIRARHNRDCVVMYPEAGYLLGNITT
ncbi:MAG: hypothetical protein NTW96_25935 [Planctomycetia bacterium]|nr:hypothetical protein [Planctomycetia bacterium]